MDSGEFVKICKRLVAEYANGHLDRMDGMGISPEDVYVVWLCKILGNNKALLSTQLPDGMYYELTYNGEKHEIYMDAYKKFENRAIRLKDVPGGSVWDTAEKPADFSRDMEEWVRRFPGEREETPEKHKEMKFGDRPDLDVPITCLDDLSTYNNNLKGRKR